MTMHDIIDNRNEKLVDHVNRILSSTEAARFAVGYFFVWEFRCHRPLFISRVKEEGMPTTQTDTRIGVERPTEERLRALGVTAWPIWTKERSTFEWVYDEAETCYFLEGEVTVITDQGRVTIHPGDLVIFPKGLACTWQVTQPVRKHYRFGK